MRCPDPLSWLALCVLGVPSALAAQEREQPASQDPLVVHYGIDAEAAQLFAKVEPEFLRYQKLVYFGTTRSETQPGEELVDAEVKLYGDRLAAGKLEKPDRTDALLCFNLLLHRPDVGREYLKSIVAAVVPGADGFVDAAIAYGTTASGGWGERFALAGLDSEDVAWRRFWAVYLSHEATEDASAARIRDLVGAEPDPEVRVSLYYALGLLLDEDALPRIKAAFAKEQEPAVRCAMVFAVVETMGRGALEWLGSLDVADEQVRQQIQDSAEYLRSETTEENPHGFEIGNDPEFVQRFGDLESAAIAWLGREGFLDEEAVRNGKELGDEKKAELFDVLDESLGFGLEAVKGSLFAALKPEDLPRLRELRALCAYCPNGLAQARRKTLLIMIRSLRA